MKRWTWRATFWVIGIAGVLPLSPLAYAFFRDLGWRAVFRLEPYLTLAWAALPSVLFLAASFICRKSTWMQLLVAVAAVAVSVLIGGTLWYEISQHMTGKSSFGVTPGSLALLFGPVIPGVFLLICVGTALHRGERGHH
jgi:hypothetical protein